MMNDEIALALFCILFTFSVFVGYIIGADENNSTKIDITNNETNSNVVYNKEVEKNEVEDYITNDIVETYLYMNKETGKLFETHYNTRKNIGTNVFIGQV